MAKIPFHGIVAVGNTKQEAIVQYRALAKGKSATPYVDKAKSLSFVSNSSVLAHVFNPMTGNMDMTEAPKLAKLLEFASESSAENRDVNHYECKSGCGGHIVYDSDSLLKFCPVCTTSISEDAAADSDEDMDADEDLDIDSEDEADEELDAESKSTSKSKKSKSADDAPAADADEDTDEDDEEEESDDEDEEAESKSKAIPAVLKKAESKAKKFKVKTITASDDVMDSDDSDEELDAEADDDMDEDEDVDAEGDEEVAAESKSKAKTSKSAAEAKARLKKSLAKPSKRKAVAGDDVDLGDVQGTELTAEDEDLDEDLDEEEIPGDLPDAEDQLDDPIVVAGTTKTEALQMYIKERPITAAASLEVDYKVCSSKECGAHILSESSSLSACPACDSKLLEPKSMSEDEEIDLGEEDTDDSDEDQDLDMDLDIEDSDEDMAIEAADDSEEDADVDADADAEGDEEDFEEDAESTSKAKTATKAAKAPKVKVAPKFAKLRAVAADEEMSDMGDEEDFDDTEDMLDGDEDEDLEMDAMDMVDEDAEGVDEAMDVSYSSSINGKSQWTAWYKGIPVAICTATSAGKNADIFDTQDFGRAIHVSMKHAGVKNTLREMGFKPITTTVALSSSVKKRVAIKVAEAKAKLVTEKKEYSERLNAALATSAIGLTRGFFTDLQNPLKAQLHQSMSTAGIRNPEVLIHQAFKQSADQYHKVLFDKAQDILSKPADVQESLAKAVLGTNYMESSSTSVPNATEERLASMGTVPVSTSAASEAPKPDSTGSKSESGSFSEMASRVVSSLGRGKGRW